jgi:hypothetical protein
MALTTYAQLQSVVADYLNRTDLTTQIPDFITLCESRIRRTIRTKHTSVLQATLVADDTSLAFPAHLSDILSVSLSGTTHQAVLTLVSHSVLLEKRRLYTASRTPVWCAIVGDTLEFAPTSDDTYTVDIEVEGPFVPLSDSATSNWLLDDYPDVYLYGTLAESAPFLKDDERVPMWNGRFEKAMGELEQARDRWRFPGPLNVPVPRTFADRPQR